MLAKLNDESSVTGWAAVVEKYFYSTCDFFQTTDACQAYIKEATKKILGQMVNLTKDTLARGWCNFWGACDQESYC